MKGPFHSQAEPADASGTSRQECQEPREPDSDAHQEEGSAASPESPILIAPAQGQTNSVAISRREDTRETCEPLTDAHHEPVTGALPPSAQPITRDESSKDHDGSCAYNGTPSPGLLETLRSQMSAGFQRRNEQYAQEIFDKYKSPDSAGLSKESLAQVLSDLGICLSTDQVEELLYTQGLKSDSIDGEDRDDCISWSEFLMIISKPSKVEEWATTLPLAALLADCMPSTNDADPLRGLSELCLEDTQAISACFCEGLVKLLRYVHRSVLPVCACLSLVGDYITALCLFYQS
jgi:hypothetical protein